KPPSGVAGVEIHPKIKEVGLRMSSMEIVGSNARAEAVLVTFSKVIADYTAPPLTDISRNLTQYVTTQINFLVYQRPMCIGMGNAIRWLKLQIGKIQPGVNDEEAKGKLVDMISEYVQERITAAGAYIAEAGAYKIQDGDVILTYGASSTVERLLLDAKHKLKRRFRVIVIDPRPQSEGRDLGRGRNGMNGGVTYAPVTALSFVMREASKVFLGAEAFFANGAMLSRAGTAMVALAAHSYHVPVIAACETYKFSERIQLDAVVSNELDTPDALIFKTGIPDAQPVGPKSDSTLDWRSTPNLRLLNLTQDITPSVFVTMIITEVGMIPTTSIPVVLREYKNQN
ncbi:eukaryotic translation initiation factor 2B delta subunit, partial [Kickxella alabastrina]|uniref:eukaryotic translation initiation factor 2B delta subunit n=1 Tax=Kickxella alabastrina TaxID=61397 RepID=UPI00221FC8BA